MKIQTWLVALASTALGLIGATVTYQQLTLSAGGPATTQTQTDPADTTQAADRAAPSASPVVKVRFRGCPRGFELRHKTCVKEVQRTVVVDVPAAAQPAVAPAPVSPVVDSEGPRDGSQGSRGDDRHPGDGRGESHQSTGAHHGDDDDHAGEDHSDDRDDHADEDAGDDHGDEDDSHEDEPEDD